MAGTRSAFCCTPGMLSQCCVAYSFCPVPFGPEDTLNWRSLIAAASRRLFEKGRRCDKLWLVVTLCELSADLPQHDSGT